MRLLRQHRWFVTAAGITLAFAVVCVAVPHGPALTAVADIFGLVVMVGAMAVALANAWQRSGQERSFWALMAVGLSFWVANQAAWTVWEAILRRPIPDPFVFDIILFF